MVHFLMGALPGPAPLALPQRRDLSSGRRRCSDSVCQADRRVGDGASGVAGEHTGSFKVGGDIFSMHVKNLPTLVESYKTYDDVHIVKSNDIGQVGVEMVIATAMLLGPSDLLEAFSGNQNPTAPWNVHVALPTPPADVMVAKTYRVWCT